MSYKITYFKATNFIGIWEGTNQFEIEIDLSKSKNRIVILAGRNGSGKTTVLSSLHPLAYNGDVRKNLILPNREGYKEIHIQKDEDKYVIKHHYTDSTKSYISKNGKELNPNGGVKTFEATVFNELQFDKSYFRIGRIGDNNQNFIDMTATERKKFIFENFLPNVDEYLHYFKIVKEKYSDLNSNIKFLSDELNKIEDPDNLYLRVEKEGKDITLLEDKLSKVKSSIQLNTDKIQDILSELDIDNHSKINQLVRSLTSEENRITEELDEFNTNYEITTEKIGTDINSYYLNTKEKELEYKTKIENYKNKLKDYNRKFIELSNLRDSERSKLMSMSSIKDNQENIVEELDSITNEIESSKNVLKENYSNHYDFITNNDISVDDIYNYKNLISNISEHMLSVIRALASNGDFVDTLKDSENHTKAVHNKIKKLDELIESTRDEINKVSNEIDSIQANAKKTNVLKLRPEDCTIDSCGFIKDALETQKKLKDDYPKLKDQLEQLEDQYSNYKNEKLHLEEYWENVLYPLLQIGHVYEANKKVPLFNYHFNECIDLDGEFNIFELALVLDNSTVQDIFNNTSKEIRTTFTTINNLESLENKKERLETRLQLIKSEESVINEINERIAKYKNDLEDINILIDEETGTMTELEIKHKKITNRLTFISNLIEQKNSNREKLEELNEIRSKLEKLEGYKDKINLYSEKITELGEEENEIEARLRILSKSQKENLVKITRYENYTERKAELDADFETVKLIYEALDPKNGIPVHLIGNYLKDTAKITNNLLDISQKGNFHVDFLVNEKEFKIPVITGDISSHKEDITLASQGQQALAKVSLSLALAQQSVKDYNIFALDEMDSTLDSENSKHYIDMLEYQGDEIGCQQMFIISHTREFESHNVDLILMREHGIDIERESIMEGKTILYNYYDKI